jgi:hypothetical protein
MRQQAAEITETSYFKDLQQQAQLLRDEMSQERET